MKAPRFWSQRSILTEFLVPFSALYFIAIRLKQGFARQPQKIDVPVLCVGNITAGGSGKTPVAIALVKALKKEGYKPAFLSRGYKGSITKNTRVTKNHTPSEVGDEPVLLAKVAPTYIGANRYLSAQMAMNDGATLLIMDDGLQHTSLAQDVRLLVIDGAVGYGNELLLPAGPLRDKPSTVADVDMVVIVGKDDHDMASRFDKAQLFNASYRAAKKNVKPKKNTTYLPFAGIGRPDKFFYTLDEHGFPFKACVRLPDHHRYRDKDIALLKDLAKKHKARLITTEKDAIKLPTKFLKQVDVFAAEVTFKQSRAIITAIKKSLS